MGEVAERWLELGETEKARALFAEGRKLVETLPPQKRTDAGSFLAHLARVEPAVPLALIEDVGPTRWRERTYGNIAIRLAFEHPAEAEAVLNRIEEPIWRIFGAPRICRRLARKDWPRARRIAAGLPNPAERAYAWTFLADGLAAERSHRPPRPPWIGPCARSTRSTRATASRTDRAEPGRLDPAAGRADRSRSGRRGLLAGRRAAAPRATTRGPTSASDGALPSRGGAPVRATTATWRRSLFEPVAAFVRSRPLRDDNDIIPAVLVALTCLDPRTAVEVVEGLPPAKTPGVSEPTNWARITVAELLAKPPDRRWMGIWRFYSGCGIAMFEDVYRGL